MCDSEPRWRGIQKVAQEEGITIDPQLVFELPALADPASGFEGGRRFSHAMRASGRPFTAVMAFDDLTALGVVRGLTEAGVRVPEDCSVMGFDDILPAEVATPSISTIRQPLTKMGVEIADWALNAIGQHASDEKPRLHMPSPELVARMSTGPAPAQPRHG
jgi:LacI family transcriptional regulator